MQRNTLTLLCVFPKAGKKISLVKGAFMISECRKSPLLPEMENLGQETYTNINKPCYFFNSPKPKLCLDSSLIDHPKTKFLCPLNY